MTWFTQERTATAGAWMPVLYRDKPAINGKTMLVGNTGSRARRKEAIEIAPEHMGRSLTDLNYIYGVGEE